MNKKTLWEDTLGLKEHPHLDQNLEIDILIIGGGITGLLCAYELKKRNFNVIVIEQDKIGRGTSKDTTAFITAQHETLYQDLIKNNGLEKAKEYLELNLRAVAKYKELSEIFDFDFKECNSTLYSSTSKNLILKEKEALEQLNYQTNLINKLPFDIDIKAGITFPNQGTINPLKLINELSKELIIYEKTKITKIKGNYAYTDKGYSIKFNKLVIATHYPLVSKKSLYFAKVTQRRSYVVALPYQGIEGTYCSIDEDGLYFRQYEDYLIVGGNDRDSKQKCYQDFENKVSKYFDREKIEYSWSGQDCITLDGIPYIGQFSMWHNNYYVATGFNLWGFTWAMASSFIIADLIEAKRMYSLTCPQRFFINKQLFINIGTALKNLVTFKTPRCTHMGCALNYNKVDKVWECPCHGSRYDEKGNVLDGPAMKKIK